MDSEEILQGIQANLTSSTWRLPGKLSISKSNVVCHIHNHSKKHSELLNCSSHNQNIAKLLTHSGITQILILYIYMHCTKKKKSTS